MNTTPSAWPEPAHPSWYHRAKCRDLTDPYEIDRLFFPMPNHNPGPGRLFCADCPVSASCAAYARNEGVDWGTWGGVTEDERFAERRALGPAAARRPRDRVKRCGSCQQTKPVTEFGSHRGRSDKLAASCKSCAATGAQRRNTGRPVVAAG